MYGKSSLQLRKRGSVLPLVVIAIVLAITLGVGMLRFGLQARVFAARTSHEIAAQAAADAGLIRALWGLNQNVEAKYAADDLPRQTGQTLENSNATYTYEVTVPDYGTLVGAKGDTVTFEPGDSGTYRGIKLSSKGGQPGVLEIDGGDVVLHLTGRIDLGNGAEIVVRNNSSLILYADGDMASDNEAGFVNENPSVATLKIIGTDPDAQMFELKAKTDVFGAVYAPNADVELCPKAELYGAISAKSISIKSKAVFKYDKTLKNVKPSDDGAHFAIEKWWE